MCVSAAWSGLIIEGIFHSSSGFGVGRVFKRPYLGVEGIREKRYIFVLFSKLYHRLNKL